MSDERKRVQVRISPEKKKKWVEAVNDGSVYNNLSHLIIRAVERELSDEEQVTSTNEPTTVNVDLEPIKMEIQELRGEVREVKSSMSSIEASAAESSEILKLSREILQMVPNHDDWKDEPIEIGHTPEEWGVAPSKEVVKEDIEQFGRKNDIIEYFVLEGYNPDTVKLAIDKLTTDMSRVNEINEAIVRET